ncbi:MAG: tetratricopeptide repeat protein [Gammaproteobacteria bacterium]|nr:tetratricopeptide repeat protein [Gammaproteobacteria bacterium]
MDVIQERQLLSQGITAAKQGRKKDAIALFKQVLKINPRNVHAWLWIGYLVEDAQAREYCARKVLEIEPYNQYAIRMLPNADLQPESRQPREQVLQSERAEVYAPHRRKKTSVKIKERQHPKKKRKSGCAVVVTLFVVMIGLVIMMGILDSMGQDEMGQMVMIMAFALWILSGYYGAFLLLKKGYGAEFLSCLFLAGGAPLWVPAFFGLFMFAWGKLASDRTKRHID